MPNNNDDNPDTIALIERIRKSPTLDAFMVMSPNRLAGARTALISRLRDERAAWELKRGDRASVSLSVELDDEIPC
jgi:hypothetical protein